MAAVGLVLDELAPRQLVGKSLDLLGGVAGSIQPADDGAHRGAGNAVHRHVQLFEHLEDTDVGEPERAAAGEHEPDTGPVGSGLLRRRRATCGGKR